MFFRNTSFYNVLSEKFGGFYLYKKTVRLENYNFFQQNLKFGMKNYFVENVL